MDNKSVPPELISTAQGLTLKSELGTLHLDFVGDRQNFFRPLKKGKNEIIAKAIGIAKGFKDVVDVTAGLGQDAVVMVRLGCRVRAVERSPWIFPLLQDAKLRASGKLDWVERLDFFSGESCDFLKKLSPQDRPQVIYLDPMFPEKKKKGLPRKEMQIFRSVIGNDQDAEELFRVSMQIAQDRVVVKRPLKAADLAPGVVHRFLGSSVRYDLYLPSQKSQLQNDANG